MKKTHRLANPKNQAFSLVEMLIAIVIGLIVVLAVINIYTATNKTITASNSVSKIQESMRIVMELTNQELRAAGSNPCSANIELGSSLNNQSSGYWADWKNGLKGYGSSTTSPGTSFGTGLGERVSGTDAFDVFYASTNVSNVTTKMSSATSSIQTDNSNSYTAGDFLFVCDTNTGFIFQATSVNATGLVGHAASGTPGNCSSVFSYTDSCNSLAAGYLFDTNAQLGRVSATRWYIGNNRNGGRSLFRASLRPNGSSSTPIVFNVTEISQNVSDMDVEYFAIGATDFQTASAITNWKAVNAVKITSSIQVKSPNLTKKDGILIQKSLEQVISLRSKAEST